MNAPHPAQSAPPALGEADIRAIIVGLMMAMLLAALDQTIVATAMPTIGRELGDAADLPWIVTAYLVASTAVTPLYGKFADIYGRRITLLVAIVVFVAGSIACAVAPTMTVLAAARGLQGVGGGGLIALGQTILGDMLSPRERARYQAHIAAVFAASSMAGPLLGGFFAQHLHWSLIFWINLPIGVAAFLMTNGRLKRLPRLERPSRVDYWGAVLLVAATVSLLLALSWGGTRYPWTAPQVLGLIVGSAVASALLVARLATANAPLIPLSILRDQVVATATLAACFAMGTFIGLAIYIPIFLQGVLGYSASQSGIALIPLMIGTVTGATLSGRSMMRFAAYKRLPLVGMAISVCACATLTVAARALPLAALDGLMFLISLGLGTILPLSTIAIQNSVAPHQLGTALASMNFFRSLGGALIVALFGAIVVHGSGAAGLTPDGGGAGTLDADRLAATFQVVFGGATVGLALAMTFLALMEQRPLLDRRDAPAAVALSE